MKLIKNPQFNFTPLSELGRIENRLREFFEEPVDGMWSAGWMAATEIEELDTEFTITMELPGVKQDAIDIEYENGVLSIRGEKTEESERKQPQLLVWERYYGKFQRSFVLPKAIDVDKVKADFKDGILTVRLPKTETARGKKILLQPK